MSDLTGKFPDSDGIDINRSKRIGRGRAVILAVGEIRLWRQAGRIMENTSDMAFTEFQDLNPTLLDLIAPDVVLSPLLTRSFDCLDLATLLHEARFRGRYRIVSSAVAKPRLLLSEIAASCPGLDVNVIELEIGPRLKVH